MEATERYTSSMHPIPFWPFAIVDTLLILAMIWYGFTFATEGEGPRKGKAMLIASLAWSAWLCMTGLEPILWKGELTIHEFEGKIESAQIHRSDSEHYCTNLQIRTDKGSEIFTHTCFPSPFFLTGKHLRGHYWGDDGELMNASFFTADGKQEGVFGKAISRWELLSNIVEILLGLFFAWLSFKIYHRDPEGTGKWLCKRA